MLPGSILLDYAADAVGPTAEDAQFQQDNITSYSKRLDARARLALEGNPANLGLEGRFDNDAKDFTMHSSPRRAGLLLALCLFPGACDGMSDSQGFDAEQWRAGQRDAAFYERRHHMAGELIDKHLKPGLSREQVLALLGPPDDRSGGVLRYTLGSSYGADIDYLTIRFDERDRLKSAAVTHG